MTQPATSPVRPAPAPGTIAFTKGHGTRNDFVLIADPEGALDLGPKDVRRLADRRGGIGADGVIRLAPTAALAREGDEAAQAALAENPAAEWFMDYRNADGSVAEMCGNGVRVLAAFAEREGLADLSGGPLSLGTRGGVKRVTKESGGWYAVHMGSWFLPGGDAAVSDGYDAAVAVHGWTAPRPALSVDLGNPHTVVALASVEELDSLELTHAPEVAPRPLHGTNVELVVPLGEEEGPDGVVGRLRMRVHERGVGETPSCGTGACAAALAVRTWQGGTSGDGAPDIWIVEVPGGEVRVRILAGGTVELAGPAELVYSGQVVR